MAIPRSKIVNPEITSWYHCISRCVRGMFLLDAQSDWRKRWIDDRLKELTSIFSIGVGSYSTLDSHLHLLLNLDTKSPKSWTKEEVLLRWAKLFPPRNKKRQPLQRLTSWLREKMADHRFLNERRRRLGDLSWFMKCLKEPLARLANEEEGVKGPFWTPRFKSIAILDQEALLATSVYIDLNPQAANMVGLPEEAKFTSLRERIDHCRKRGYLPQLLALRDVSVVSPMASQALEAGIWLCPVDDQRAHGDSRIGLADGFSLPHYLRLVDVTSRLFRPNKARVDANAEPLLQRIGTTAEVWMTTIQLLFDRDGPLGTNFAFSREALRRAAEVRGVRHVVNLNGCPA